MNYATEMKKLIAKHGSARIDDLFNQACEGLESEVPGLAYTASDDGISIENYEEMLEKAEDGSTLCDGQPESEKWAEEYIIEFIKDELAL